MSFCRPGCRCFCAYAKAPPAPQRRPRRSIIFQLTLSTIRRLVTVSLFLCGLPLWAASVKNPIVILITIDTLRADHLGCYGYAAIHTPNIDALSADGVQFENAYSAVPITLPSHASMMTGAYPMQTGMHDFSGNRLGSAQPTMAGILRQHGYATGAVVASAVLDSRFGLNSGFDFYYDHFDFNRLSEANLDAMERPGNLVMDEALKWLQSRLHANSPKQVFLWVHLYDPHHPYNPPAPYAEEYRAHPYDGEIAFADAQVGRLIGFLKKESLYDHTLIVLAGDHGEGLGEHGEKTHGFFIYNSTLHVPLIFKGVAMDPAKGVAKGVAKSVAKSVAESVAKSVAEYPPHRNVITPVSLVDLLPTVLDLLQLPVPAGVQGKSLKPLLQGDAPTGAGDLYSETYLPRIHFNWSELRGILKDRYHFIDAPRPELYDLQADPGELNNLYSGKLAVSAELRAELATVIRKNTPGQETVEKTSLDPVMLERLKSLGYVAVSSGATATLSDQNLPDPKDRLQVYELISSAIDDSQHGRYDSSMEKLQATLKTEAKSIPVHYLLGLDFYRKHDFKSATREFEEVLSLSPGYALAAYYLGLAQGAAGDWDASIVSLQRALQLDKTNFAAAFNLGAAYLQKRSFDQSLEAFRRSVSINPSYAQGYEAIGEMLLFQGKTDEAIPAFKQALIADPENAKSHLGLAQAYELKGMTEEAAQERSRAAEMRRQP